MPALERSGLFDLNTAELSTYIGRKSPFDRFFIPRSEWNAEFRYARQYALIASDSEAHEEYLSDHYPIVMAFRAVADDD